MGQEFEYDVFLSHSAKDKAVVRQLAERLRQDGLKVWFDKWEIKAGDNIPAMRSGVAFRWSALLDLGGYPYTHGTLPRDMGLEYPQAGQVHLASQVREERVLREPGGICDVHRRMCHKAQSAAGGAIRL